MTMAKFLSLTENLFLKALNFSIKAFARRKSMKKLKGNDQLRLTKETNVVPNGPTAEVDYVKDGSDVSSVDNFAAQKLTAFPARSSVLQACTLTCGVLAALGLIIRQVLYCSPALIHLLCSYLLVPYNLKLNL